MGKESENERNKIVKDSFNLVHDRIERHPKIDGTFSGTTCVVTLISRSQLICANSGDSRAILGSYVDGRWIVKTLSRDHKPDEADEALRVRKRGGRIQ